MAYCQRWTWVGSIHGLSPANWTCVYISAYCLCKSSEKLGRVKVVRISRVRLRISVKAVVSSGSAYRLLSANIADCTDALISYTISDP